MNLYQHVWWLKKTGTNWEQFAQHIVAVITDYEDVIAAN